MIAYLSLIVAVVGLVLYSLSTQAKPAEVGRLMLACGLLAWLLQYGHTVSFLR
jgi:hypothetical protein